MLSWLRCRPAQALPKDGMAKRSEKSTGQSAATGMSRWRTAFLTGTPESKRNATPADTGQVEAIVDGEFRTDGHQ